jgi:hypothetical protein
VQEGVLIMQNCMVPDLAMPNPTMPNPTMPNLNSQTLSRTETLSTLLTNTNRQTVAGQTGFAEVHGSSANLSLSFDSSDRRLMA